jgi:methylmalonyl-CoA mutase
MIDPLAAYGDPAPSREAWLRAAERALQGASADAPRPGGLVAPLQERARGRRAIAGRSPGARWRIVQRIDHGDADEAATLLREELDGGADGISLVAAGTPAGRGSGLESSLLAEPARILDDARLDGVDIRLEAGGKALEAAQALLRTSRNQGVASFRAFLGFDPIGCLAQGAPCSSGWMAQAAALARDAGEAARSLSADGRPYHDAGATAAHEVGATLATALAYLRALEGAGIGLDRARAQLAFVLSADQDIFVTIAKLRALRLAWGHIEEACGLAAAPIHLHAETSWRMLTRMDPWTNLVRGTVAAFAAGVGGADSVAVLPFSTALGVPDRFARRAARNAQHILMAEANLHRVADPAAGSGAIEALTDRLCHDAWTFLQAIERQGGIIEALAKGFVTAELAQAVADEGEPPIVGTTAYPSPEPSEIVGVIRALDADAQGKAEGPLVPRRLAGAFEGATR